MPWYQGPTLMQHLETVPVADAATGRAFRLPVQWVNRPNADFRGFAGLIASGSVQQGRAHARAALRAREPGGAHRYRGRATLPQAVAGQSVTLTLTSEVDVSRGDVIAAADAPPQVASQFEATIVWMHEEPMLQGRAYLMKAGTRTVTATIAPLKHKINVNTLEQLPAERLELNDIGVCELELDRAIPFEPYARQPRAGRLHPHRPAEQQHRRGRADQLCAAPLAERALAGARRGQAGARAPEGAAGLRAVADRAFRAPASRRSRI